MDYITQTARSQQIAQKILRILQKRLEQAQEQLGNRVRDAVHRQGGGSMPAMPEQTPFDSLGAWRYAVDLGQRSVLFWDTLRQRGNEFVERNRQGIKPALHFDYDVVLDARHFERPVNYALLSIRPPEGVTIDAGKRPYLIIDPRAGHGPGIGGFKDDSQVGVALRAGHPVYFVVFSQEPEPGQTLLDVCVAEQQFVRKVRELHPDSQKPAIVGNCQGGWAAMMLASSSPEDTGPIVVNGAPMSYWSGAWSEGETPNPMRYAGGILGGTWLSSLTADLGNGKFDGAYLVDNFEYLNPANTLWDKYYNLFANIDTEPARFLDFERWWGSYYLMNREEIEWITRNLFIGNRLWSGDVGGPGGKSFDLRDIRSPIVLFASLGDNITPAQQAFNWVADLYGSTEEIKARGQVIVALMHEDVGHLGIFVSGKVAKKEYTQIFNVLETIETLAPGLYGMSIAEVKGAEGNTEYEVSLTEHRLEEAVEHFNRFRREDEKPFQAVAAISEFNQRAYELFLQPFVQRASNEASARALRDFHPLRLQRWAFSDLNPWLSWLAPAADVVRANRQPADGIEPWRNGEQRGSEIISASLDYYRAMRDAGVEALFFSTYGNLFALHDRDSLGGRETGAVAQTDPRSLPFVQEALASMKHGGYNEAVARTAFLLAPKGEPLPLARIETIQELVDDYADYLPGLPPADWRRIRGEQELIATYEPAQAIATLPTLLATPEDRERLLTLLERLLADRRVQRIAPTAQQLEALQAIQSVLGKPVAVASPRPRSPVRRTQVPAS
jgi:pimeloyl-ACP methyl ester carboxylesterase